MILNTKSFQSQNETTSEKAQSTIIFQFPPTFVMFHEVCCVWRLVRLIWWANVFPCAGQNRCLDSVTVSHVKDLSGIPVTLGRWRDAHYQVQNCPFTDLKLRINREQPGDCLQSHSEYIPRNPTRSQRLAAQFGTGKLAWSVFQLFPLQD